MAQAKVKHQVFVSSTFKDLWEARMATSLALLKLGCIPEGMESFAPSNKNQWQTIRESIDGCACYVVIVGGRYGTIVPKTIAPNSSDISFTEMEYHYAKERGIDIFPFLCTSPESLLVGDEEKDGETKDKKEKLRNFRSVLETEKTAGYWETPEELRMELTRGLLPLLTESKFPCWMCSTNREDEDKIMSMENENAQLREQVEATEGKLQTLIGEKFADGHQTINICYVCYGPAVMTGIRRGTYDVVQYPGEVRLTYNDIIRLLIRAANLWCLSDFFLGQIVKAVGNQEKARWMQHLQVPPSEGDSIYFGVEPDSVEDVLFRLEQMNILYLCNKQGKRMWTLTDQGKSIITQLRFE